MKLSTDRQRICDDAIKCWKKLGYKIRSLGQKSREEMATPLANDDKACGARYVVIVSNSFLSTIIH